MEAELSHKTECLYYPENANSPNAARLIENEK